MCVGDKLSSATSKLRYEIVDNLKPPPREDHRVIIVDTPSFDAHGDFTKILRLIADWLASS